MAQTASTMQQIIRLVLFVLPGVSYQFVRERMRGPVPGERDLSERVLRALIASVVLDAIYLIAAGPQIVHLAARGARPGRTAPVRIAALTPRPADARRQAQSRGWAFLRGHAPSRLADARLPARGAPAHVLAGWLPSV